MLNKSINFIGNRKYALIFSGLLSFMSLVSLGVNGLHLGIDFTGGSLIQVGYKESVDLNELRKSLAADNLGDATVQHFGSTKDVLIRLKLREGVSSKDLSTKVLEVINRGRAEPAELHRVEFVGPQVGEDLAQDGFLALLYSCFGILVYVAWRFEWKFSTGAIIATVHDVIVTLGLFSAMSIEFDLTVLAAILALIGYSLNDTIVIYDRIRENFLLSVADTTEEVMNIAVNETLSRTIMTSLTVFLVLLSLFFLGGEVIHNFALALLFGVVFGTYSSIFIASPAALMLGICRQDLLVQIKEGYDDGMP